MKKYRVEKTDNKLEKTSEDSTEFVTNVEHKVVDSSNKRIDKYICEINKDITRTAVQRMILHEKILVNGQTVKASYILNKDDLITIEEEFIEESDIRPQEIPLNIIYEDNDILAINKEKGMVVHPRKR